jgi:hypothetical protein
LKRPAPELGLRIGARRGIGCAVALAPALS